VEFTSELVYVSSMAGTDEPLTPRQITTISVLKNNLRGIIMTRSNPTPLHAIPFAGTDEC
jgi:hypothetical protein